MARPKRTSDVGTALATHIVRHGLAGDIPVIPGVEPPEDAQAHYDAIVADWQPEGAMECEYVKRIAGITWRLRRAGRYEVDSIALSRERVEFDFARQRAWDGRPTSVEEAKERARTARRIVRMVESITKVPPETVLPGDDVDRFLEELANDADMLVDDFLNKADRRRKGADWTAADLIKTLQIIGKRDGKAALEEAMVSFVRRAFVLAAGAEREATQAREDMDRMKRERLMPGAHALEAIARYETALNRMLFQTVTQLEAAQARRNGAPVPPALRVQHYGSRNG